MNNIRRDKLRTAANTIGRACSMVSAVLDEESDSLDNVPENLQGTERYENMEDAVDLLGDALEKLDEAKELILSAANK